MRAGRPPLRYDVFVAPESRSPLRRPGAGGGESPHQSRGGPSGLW
jgi:hypothetical protein